MPGKDCSGSIFVAPNGEEFELVGEEPLTKEDVDQRAHGDASNGRRGDDSIDGSTAEIGHQ